MRFPRSVLVALGVGLAAPAMAGQGAPADGATVTAATITAPPVDTARLPVNVGRIGRQLREVQVREERNGLKINYTINVFGELPRIQFITPLDNILTGDVPNSAPTHNDMIRQMTPQEFSAPVIGIGSLPRKK